MHHEDFKEDLKKFRTKSRTWAGGKSVNLVALEISYIEAMRTVTNWTSSNSQSLLFLKQ
ncbi:hypothetical protein STEG23_001696, partial [Scotinomys teguina]